MAGQVVNAPVLQNNTMLSWADVIRRKDPKGNIADIAEVLNENNEIIQDIAFKEGNLDTGDQQTMRAELPPVFWRQMNRGTPVGKTSVVTITETCAELAARSQMDVRLAELSGDPAGLRASEDKPVLESMSQKLTHELFYGNVGKTGEGFCGLATRYSTLDTGVAGCAKNVIDCGGTGKNLTSIYIVGWGDNIYCPFPKGSKLGLQKKDLGQQLVDDDLGNKYLAYMTMYSWNVGLMVRDWRYCVRLCNINVQDLFDGKGIGNGDLKTPGSTNILLKLNLALSKLRRQGKARWAMYMNTDAFAGLDVAAARTDINVIKFNEAVNQYGDHTSWASYHGIPIRQCDQIVNTETQVK